MKKTNCSMLLSVGLMLLLAACGKSGKVGPSGPAGKQGATGATGTANVIYSDWITPPSYTVNTIYNLDHFNYNIAASQITQTILDSGSVIVYGKLSNNLYNDLWPADQVGKLPIVLTYMPIDIPITDTWSAFVTLGNIKIDLLNSANAYTTGIGNEHSFRYVIIPGEVHTLGSVNPKNYQQVAHALHIPN